MSRDVIIFGPVGSGKTTLGRIVAQALGFPYCDIDDYIWHWDTSVPYTTMRTREEKISGLMSAISSHEHFVMTGSMSSFRQHFDPLFDLAVLLTCDATLRTERVHVRELANFGERILPRGRHVQRTPALLTVRSGLRHRCRIAQPARAYGMAGLFPAKRCGLMAQTRWHTTAISSFRRIAYDNR